MKLSRTQTDAIETIRWMIEQHQREFEADDAAGLHDSLRRDGYTVRPSRWVTIDTAERVHHVSYRTIRSLIRRGILIRRSTHHFDEITLAD